MSAPRIVPAGDAVLLVEFEERMDPIVSARATAVADAVESERIRGVRDVVPTYRSVAVYFDPLETDHAKLTRTLQAIAAHSFPLRAPDRGAAHEVPVCYGGDFGPDLASVAALRGLTETDVIALHSATTYRVFMIGFMPGFAYMGTVDPQIATPRLEKPRTRVPRGSVGIAQRQTGIYPSDGPGGWQLIGRTPVRPFDLSRADPFLFRAGDDVRFVAIGREEFERLDRAG